MLPATPAGAEPEAEADRPTGINARVDRLYERAEGAIEAYNAVAERTRALRLQAERAQDRIARGQAQVNRMRGALAALAGAEYRSSGLDPSLALLLTEDPGGYLDKAATLDRIGSLQRGKIRQLQGVTRVLDQRRSEAADKLVRLERERRELKRRKQEVRRKLGSARRLLNQLTSEQRAERERAARGAARTVLGGAEQKLSGRAGAAVAAVRSVIGAPYSWGASGPSSFDCSGLTQWAYRQAGVALPRTSQGQRSAGSRVPLGQAQPGDLVLYREDASHVGMYVGGGRVVHAPYPGASVRFDPVGMMPVSAVVRPGS
nr:NlpC/P60 family protein [Streptomyces sp. AJS327]